MYTVACIHFCTYSTKESLFGLIEQSLLFAFVCDSALNFLRECRFFLVFFSRIFPYNRLKPNWPMIIKLSLFVLRRNTFPLESRVFLFITIGLLRQKRKTFLLASLVVFIVGFTSWFLQSRCYMTYGFLWF